MLELRVTGPNGAVASAAQGEDEIFVVHGTPCSEDTVPNVAARPAATATCHAGPR
jgi:hypothetical protein